MAKNLVYHSRTKHVALQYYFTRKMVEDKKVSLEKVDTLKNVVDMLTKSISTKKFCWCRDSMGLAILNN